MESIISPAFSSDFSVSCKINIIEIKITSRLSEKCFKGNGTRAKNPRTHNTYWMDQYSLQGALLSSLLYGAVTSGMYVSQYQECFIKEILKIIEKLGISPTKSMKFKTHVWCLKPLNMHCTFKDKWIDLTFVTNSLCGCESLLKFKGILLTNIILIHQGNVTLA
ncbi:CLUMA_CG000269, isoform A [Clunio marinus]|uniref:CLUMA_CG000269, isoform A n=1 Tax=Clunio marinus TaxID=568069 RepID=A0A1J1HFC4_9DIPT|nr:CLUMA_CG000269, isoform A [Clunio marinus]